MVSGGWYCCAAVLLLHCPALTLARRHSFPRSIAPSIARRHHRTGVLGPLSWNARRHPTACSLARPPSLACRRTPAAALVFINLHFFCLGDVEINETRHKRKQWKTCETYENQSAQRASHTRRRRARHGGNKPPGHHDGCLHQLDEGTVTPENTRGGSSLPLISACQVTGHVPQNKSHPSFP